MGPETPKTSPGGVVQVSDVSCRAGYMSARIPL
jgi:hypothetical protein